MNGIEDLFGNTLDNFVHTFVYDTPYMIGFGDILITEIMADPTPGVDLPEFEYIEIFNPKEEVFYLNQVILIVGNDSTRIPNFVISPGEFIILCQSAAVDQLESYGRTIKVSNWPSLNNRGEQIVILNHNEEIIFSMYYHDSSYKSIEKDDGGYSPEMIDIDFPCKGFENWLASGDQSGGTPGRQNSHNEKLTDLTAPGIERIIATTDKKVSIHLNEKIGPQEISYSDIYIVPELSISRIQLLTPGFSEISIELSDDLKPNTIYTLELKNISDCTGNVQKGSASTFVLPELADSLDLIINEVLFNPRQGSVDFVEIYNQSDKYIDLNSISLKMEEFKPIASEHFIIGPNQFLVVTEDAQALSNHYPGFDVNSVLVSTSMPAYNNDEGDVHLVDGQGKVIDFFHYKEGYHTIFLDDVEGVSLERITFSGPSNDQDNWHSAASTVGFATPSKMNSQALSVYAQNDQILIEPSAFAPGINGFHDFTTIKCRFPSSGNMASIQILDRTGRQIKTIISHQSIGAEEDFKWEGFDDHGQEVQMGPYIVYVEIYNASGERKLFRKKVVVGKRLN